MILKQLKVSQFYAANQTATATSVALATTYTGLCVSNPAASKKNLVITKVGLALTVAPAGIASIGLITGSTAAGIVTHTTPLTPASTNIGSGISPSALADNACTLVGTPVWTVQLVGGFTAAALPAYGATHIELGTSLVIPPGAYVAVGTLTSVTGLFSLEWQEVPFN
jgi:hypothetical protein